MEPQTHPTYILIWEQQLARRSLQAAVGIPVNNSKQFLEQAITSIRAPVNLICFYLLWR